MTGRDFLVPARVLAVMPSEAAWRSAVSRAYYAAFHVAREFVQSLGFRVPKDAKAHVYLEWRLANCRVRPFDRAGARLGSLRVARTRADYDLHRDLQRFSAEESVADAVQIIALFIASPEEPVRIALIDAIKTYERDVLRDITWRS